MTFFFGRGTECPRTLQGTFTSFMCIYVYIYIYIYICMYVCIYIYIYIYFSSAILIVSFTV